MDRFTCNAISIMYHDVLDEARAEPSGFEGLGARIYKLAESDFRAHLDAIGGALGQRRVALADAPEDGRPRLYLTFDDGGASAATRIADALEARGWRGHFFIPTDYIGRPGFLAASQIAQLNRRGHLVGSHSRTHPPRISHCGWEHLLEEWRASVNALGEITGKPPAVASVPGGFYSERVARAASAAGIAVLFNSEPTTRVRRVDGCAVLGRYVVRHGMGAADAAAFAGGRLGPRARQAAMWQVKRAAKAAGGGMYFTLRELLLTLRAG